MSTQQSMCRKCGKMVDLTGTSEGRAIFHCSCGKRWTTPAYYGKQESQTSGGAVVGGAAIGGVIGGVPGAIVGGILGGLFGTSAVTAQCMRCGGTGRPTGRSDKKTMFQCEECKRTWVQRS